MRAAWGQSIDSPDAAWEWELGSRVLEGLEAENTPILGEATVRLRASRAYQVPEPGHDGEQYIDCLIVAEGHEDETYFCYDMTADGYLMCNIVDPPLPQGVGEVTLIDPILVVDWTEWTVEKEAKTRG